LADVYADWLPEDTRETILKGAYYTVLVKPGFRIIALNNNDCYTYNWWVWYGQESMREQLQWFHDTLLAAEQAGEKVHVVIHIPSGEGSCNSIWSREYTKIIERFHRTISAQFTGHTHKDEFNIYYDRTNKVHATSISFNAGSLTPFSNVNPNYAIYYVDNELFQVNEYESWIFNLTEANLNPGQSPRWFKQYSFKEDFGLQDLTPASVDQLVYSMAKNKNRLNQFWTYKVKGGDPSLAQGCDKDCQKTTLCEIVVTDFADRRKCEELVSILNTVS
jgi:sphingomyelin phosphodiesterase